jgi:hypothetical protein
MIITNPLFTKKRIFVALAVVAILFTGSLVLNKILPANALSGSQWRAGNIIDDGLFYNGNDMSVEQIQSFLNQKVPNCDTNGTQQSELGGGTRAQYAASKGYSLPIICLKEYYENPSTRATNLGTGQRPAGSISAAQIIKNASAQHGVGAKVLLVILEKEMSLITDTWPLPNSYRKAMGFACPDTAPCDAQYYGFANQVASAARQYIIYKNNPNAYRHVAGRSNNVLLNPVSSCGSTAVFIASTATAGLYNYTPYQPNQAALNNLYGLGDGCSAYGNRNFWTMYNNMFGSTSANPSYGYSVMSKELFSDAARQNKLPDNPSVTPDTTVYGKVAVRNNGNQTWYQDSFRLGTQNPMERVSAFATGDWISLSRVVRMNEASVTAGGTATFTFTMKTPSQLTSFNENFGTLIEGQRWLDGAFSIPITVATSSPYYSIENLSFNAYSDSAMTRQINPNSISAFIGSKLYFKAVIKNTGNQPLPANLTKLATSDPLDRVSTVNDSSWLSATRVVTATEGTIDPQGTGTFTFSITNSQQPVNKLKEQFGLVIEGQRWLSGNVGTAVIQTETRPPVELYANQTLELGDRLLSFDERFQLIMQSDGNLVLYSGGQALWASGTSGKGAVRLIMQYDGNLVLYRTNWTPVWTSGTSGRGPSMLIPQTDGNLVLYTESWNPTWNTRTGGR